MSLEDFTNRAERLTHKALAGFLNAPKDLIGTRVFVDVLDNPILLCFVRLAASMTVREALLLAFEASAVKSADAQQVEPSCPSSYPRIPYGGVREPPPQLSHLSPPPPPHLCRVPGHYSGDCDRRPVLHLVDRETPGSVVKGRNPCIVPGPSPVSRVYLKQYGMN